MTNQHALNQLPAIISALGGPSIQAEDIEWAIDLPAGKRLVDWVAAQLLDDEIDDGDKAHQAALRNIALEAGEVDILNHAGPRTAPPDFTNVATLDLPIGYSPPSRTNACTQYINNETRLLEEETELLKSRLRQTKLASEAMSKTITSLQDAITRENERTDQAQERLAELSIQADATVASTMDNALSLLQSLGCTSRPVDVFPNASSQLASAVTSLGHLASIRSSITDLHKSHLEQIEHGARSLPSAEEVKTEASQLHAVLNPQFIESAKEAAFKQQLSDMCELLEIEDTRNDVLQQILDDVDGTSASLDIRGELERAWSLDQAKILESKEKLLDATISSYEEDLMKPLNALYSSLSSTNEHVRNSEALLGAFGVELEELVDDVRVAKENNQLRRPKSAEERADDYLETKLMETLKSLKDMRAADAPPLVLLQRNDILEELRDVVARAHDLQEQEEKWGKDLPLALSSLSAVHEPLLSSIYEHSTVNTSPPFAFPPEVSRLQDEAERKGKNLSDHVGRLQQELESLLENKRTKRKLTAFTEQWCKE